MCVAVSSLLSVELSAEIVGMCVCSADSHLFCLLDFVLRLLEGTYMCVL